MGNSPALELDCPWRVVFLASEQHAAIQAAYHWARVNTSGR